MFTKPANEIEFSDIEDFCAEFAEGVRVEYKQQMTKDIPKIVSSFANTLGGIFIIGAEADKKTNKVIAIDGIPNSGGLEEQIQQSALTGIYPAVMPEVIILELPKNPNNVVIIIRVDESPQAPHAIQNSTKVYIRTGSITQPYKLELAEIDRIEYMLKRREDSQIVTRQILDRTEARIEFLFNNEPTITVIARPIFPYRPLISTTDICRFAINDERFRIKNERFGGPLRVTGGIYNRRETSYWELNEYGIVYGRIALERISSDQGEEQYLDFSRFVWPIGRLIKRAQSFYEECQYSGNIEVTATLRGVLGEKLMYYENQRPEEMGQSVDSEIPVSAQYLPRDLVEKEKFIEAVDELAGQLLWAFDVDDPQGRRRRTELILNHSGLLGF